MKPDVVVTGIGAVTPLGVGARTLHERWTAGTSGIEDGEGACTEFEPTEYLSVKEVRRADRFTQFALVSSDEALEEAGWDGELPYDPARVGSIIGTGIGGIGTLTHNHQVLLEQGPSKVSPALDPAHDGQRGRRRRGHAPRAPRAVVRDALGLRGRRARDRRGRQADPVRRRRRRRDRWLGGRPRAARPRRLRRARRAVRPRHQPPLRRPPRRLRDGRGRRGAVLEDGDKARERGANILAYVRGYGATSDAYHLTAPDKEGAGAAEAMRVALADAGLTPEDIVYVNAHGTSTPLNDRAETLAIKAALGDAAKDIPVSSTKSAIGHLLGAAGAVEAVATILALRDRIAPPTLGHEQPEEGLDLDYVPGKARPLDIDGKPAIGLSNAFGFGGHNAVLCLEAA